MRFSHCRVLCALFLLLSASRVLSAPAPTQLPPATEAKLRAILNDEVLHDAHIGVSIVALGTAPNAATFPSQPYDDKTQPTLFTVDAEKRFMPASNMKLFTAAFALHKLGAEHTFKTIVATESLIVDGIVLGDLYLIGGGDPSLSTADMEELAEELYKQGIRRVTGNIISDGTRIQAETFGGRYPDGWTLDDAIWYYGPEINALAINRNQIDVTITATQPGRLATLEVEPASVQFPINNRVFTAARDEKAAPLRFERFGTNSALANHLIITGQIAPDTSITEGVSVPTPDLWAADLLRQALTTRDATVRGTARRYNGFNYRQPRTLAQIESPPLRVLLQRLLKNSDNLYAEMLLRAASLEGETLSLWLQQNKIPTENLRFEDGSGLSRYNLLTPRSLTSLLSVIQTIQGGEALYNALPIAGRDGTLRKRMQSTPAANNARAKTGSFSIASTLSGYVTTRDGHRLAVSIMTNFVRDTDDARRVQDEIFAALADADFD